MLVDVRTHSQAVIPLGRCFAVERDIDVETGLNSLVVASWPDDENVGRDVAELHSPGAMYIDIVAVLLTLGGQFVDICDKLELVPRQSWLLSHPSLTYRLISDPSMM